MHSRRGNQWWGWAAALAIATSGCGNEVLVLGGDSGAGACLGEPGEGCDARVGGQCVGASVARSCEPEACVCASIQTAANGVALQAALASASPGACIELTGSGYGALSVPEGVRVLARRSSLVTVGEVTMSAGSGLCGVRAESVTVSPGADDVSLRKLRIEGGDEHGLVFEEGAGGRVADTTIVGSAEVGLLMAQSADVTIERTAISQARYFGLAGTCGDCGCPEAPRFTVRMRKVVLEESRIAGMWFEGIDVLGETLAVRDTVVGDNFEFGVGLSMRCGSIVAQGLAIENNADFGLGLFESDATISAGDLMDVRIAGNLFGLWAVNIGDEGSSRASVSDAIIEDNLGAGVALGGVVGSGVVELADSVVRGTQNVAIPVLINGVSAASEEVGDGILWMDAVEANLSNVELADNERASLLINGGAPGALEDVRFTGGDSDEVPLLQNYFGGPEPTVAGTTPDLLVTPEEVYPVPLSPVETD